MSPLRAAPRLAALAIIVIPLALMFLMTDTGLAATVTTRASRATPGKAGVSAALRLFLETGDQVAGLNLSVTYNPQELVLQRVELGAAAAAANKQLVFNEPVAGLVKLVIYSLAPEDLLADGTIGELIFDVAGDVVPGQQLPLVTTEWVLADSQAVEVATTVVPGHITIGYPFLPQGLLPLLFSEDP